MPTSIPKELSDDLVPPLAELDPDEIEADPLEEDAEVPDVDEDESVGYDEPGDEVIDSLEKGGPFDA